MMTADTKLAWQLGNKLTDCHKEEKLLPQVINF